MDKYIKVSEAGHALVNLQGAHRIGMALEKTSEVLDNQADWMHHTNSIDPRIVDWIKTYEDFDHDKYTYVMVVPLGADESWEETINGDAFEREHLSVTHKRYGHKTFETDGGAYMHHRNSDPRKSFGDFPLMVFNDRMDRCEGIWRLDNEKAQGTAGAPGLIENYRSGRDAPVSMGCRVPHDRCSVCGNEAKDPSEYCKHPHTPGFGSIMPGTGVKVRVFNPFPLFFDLSGVGLNAAPEATPLGVLFPELMAYIKSMSKTSGALNSRIVVPSAYVASYHQGRPSGMGKFSGLAPVKISDMIKNVPLLEAQVISPLIEDEEPIPGETLDKMASACGSHKGVLSNLGALGIALSPAEFSRLALGAEPEGDMPSMLIDQIQQGFSQGGMEFTTPDALRGYMLEMAKDLIPGRSILYPHMARRAMAVKDRPKRPTVTVKLTVEGVPGMERAYGAYIRELSTRMQELVLEVLSQFPGLGHDLTGGDSRPSAVLRFGSGSGVKTSELCAQALLPSAYLLSKASSLGRVNMLMQSIDALNTPQVSYLFGGVYGDQL